MAPPVEATPIGLLQGKVSCVSIVLAGISLLWAIISIVLGGGIIYVLLSVAISLAIAYCGYSGAKERKADLLGLYWRMNACCMCLYFTILVILLIARAGLDGARKECEAEGSTKSCDVYRTDTYDKLLVAFSVLGLPELALNFMGCMWGSQLAQAISMVPQQVAPQYTPAAGQQSVAGLPYGLPAQPYGPSPQQFAPGAQQAWVPAHAGAVHVAQPAGSNNPYAALPDKV